MNKWCHILKVNKRLPENLFSIRMALWEEHGELNLQGHADALLTKCPNKAFHPMNG